MVGVTNGTCAAAITIGCTDFAITLIQKHKSDYSFTTYIIADAAFLHSATALLH